VCLKLNGTAFVVGANSIEKIGKTLEVIEAKIMPWNLFVSQINSKTPEENLEAHP